MQVSSILSASVSTPSKSRSRKKSPNSVGASTTAPPYNATQLTELVRILRELGVTKFSQGDLHIELAHVGPPHAKAEEAPSVLAGPPPLAPPNQEISDEDMLFWSADPIGPPKEPVS